MVATVLGNKPPPKSIFNVDDVLFAGGARSGRYIFVALLQGVRSFVPLVGVGFSNHPDGFVGGECGSMLRPPCGGADCPIGRLSYG